jgi:hypothetical protein
MVSVTPHRGPGIARRAGATANKGRAAGTKWKGTRMPLSTKIGLVAIMAIALHSGAGHAQSTDTQDPSAQSSDTTSEDPGSLPAVDPALGQTSPDGTPYQYGVFREVAAETTPPSQRNCWVQGLVNGQTINGDLLTERVSLTQSQCVLNYLTRRGLCANQRTTSYWSARQDDTSNGASNLENPQGSNDWRNNNASQGGDPAQSSGASRHSGEGHHPRRGQHSGDSPNSGDAQNGGQWTRQGEWILNGGVNPAWLNTICGAHGTASGSTAGTVAGTGSGATGN